MKKRCGFTLVEMMTVLVVIGILAAVTMKLMGFVSYKVANARANRDLEQIKHALTAYYSVYGVYPPTVGMTYKVVTGGVGGNPAGGLKTADGLAKFLYDGTDPHSNKWIQMVASLKSVSSEDNSGNDSNFGLVKWTNSVITIYDPWWREYKYESLKPYQSFKLYSLGADGVDNTKDDIGRGFTD